MPGPGAFLVGEEERREVEDVLESGYLSRYGREDDPRFKRKVVTLEREFAHRWEVKYCVAVNGGTSAIMASLVALGVGPGVEVLVPGYTFIASISAIILVCGTPVLTEVDESLTMDPDDIEKKITENTKVIMPVHMLGNPADMDRIMALAEKHHLFVLEDVCQGLGATYKGKPLGSIGHVGAFSLNINKTITCGDGGIVITNDKDYYERAFGFHDQGHKPLRMGVEIGKRSIIGMNLRMHELSAAFANAQLNKLDNILNLLREKKGKFKKIVSDANIKNMHFRKINDPGECNTLFTVIFEDKEPAEAVAKALGTITVSGSSWHVYNNMEQLLAWTDREGNNPYQKHMLPQTDDILDRTINISVGVVDPGLGAGFGINILSSDEEIDFYMGNQVDYLIDTKVGSISVVASLVGQRLVPKKSRVRLQFIPHGTRSFPKEAGLR
jgi:8-amino-3,8-dideoxy-alpha-D-manno-octulosonate transaminase